VLKKRRNFHRSFTARGLANCTFVRVFYFNSWPKAEACEPNPTSYSRMSAPPGQSASASARRSRDWRPKTHSSAPRSPRPHPETHGVVPGPYRLDEHHLSPHSPILGEAERLRWLEGLTEESWANYAKAADALQPIAANQRVLHFRRFPTAGKTSSSA